MGETGIAGLTLGGGVGWLVRKHGLTCDNLLAADVVTADGQLRQASAEANPDLFWAIRGGGGNFGVVTSFQYRLHEVSTILGGLVIHPRAAAPDVLRFHRDFVRSAPEEVTSYAAMLTLPDGTPAVALATCYCGDLAEGEQVLRPLREFGTPMVDMMQPMPYTGMQGLFGPSFPWNNRNYWKSTYARDLPDAAIDALVEQANRALSPLSFVIVEYYGGAVSRVAPEATAFAHREANFNLLFVAQWQDATEDAAQVQWARDTSNALSPWASGAVYMNALSEGEGAQAVQDSYGPNYARLATLKAQFDPHNLFRMNQNIPPTT